MRPIRVSNRVVTFSDVPVVKSGTSYTISEVTALSGIFANDSTAHSQS